MYIPFLGRIGILDWPVVVFSFLLAWFEFIVSSITRCLPQVVIDGFTRATATIFEFLRLDSQSKLPPGVDRVRFNTRNQLQRARTIQEMASVHGYHVDAHVYRTRDDYVLTAHRIRPTGTANGKVVYLHHGLLMCSDVWVTMVDKYKNLPYLLADLGFDVWMGNNRGNKYSQKHLSRPVTSEAFWNFSMDEFAIYDIPDTVEYILKDTGQESLTYIGFSQGTAQAFAAMSINPQLNRQIDQFIGISPATTPNGLESQFLDAFVKTSPQVMFLMFSRKVLMPSIYFWQKVCYPSLFTRMIDVSNSCLFNWQSKNMSKFQKLASYAHLYSPTSVKLVVHWFQIMKARNFQMYSDLNSLFGEPTAVSYNLKTIKVPIHLVYGDSDSLVDIDVMRGQLPRKTTTVVPVRGHEHLDNLWGDDVYEEVFKHVFSYLGVDSAETDSMIYSQVPEIEAIVQDFGSETATISDSYTPPKAIQLPAKSRPTRRTSVTSADYSFGRSTMI
ncbi:sterol esterase Tgl1p [Diutina catenulata]